MKTCKNNAREKVMSGEKPSARAFRPPLPAWIRSRVQAGAGREKVAELISDLGLHTVCHSANCPNQGECWHRQTATFMIMGDLCTRDCRFCAVRHGVPKPLDPDEPRRVAEAVRKLELRYAVITSVTRDDLPDGGAGHFAAVIRALRAALGPEMKVEVLTPDFNGDRAALETVLRERPTVFNHNVETVERLSSLARYRATYRRSLDVLRMAADIAKGALSVKSGLMVGLGETDDEVVATLNDLRAAGVSSVTIGQYLPPGPTSWPLDRYVPPETFKAWETLALSLGFKAAACGPLVRSSYRADELDAHIASEGHRE